MNPCVLKEDAHTLKGLGSLRMQEPQRLEPGSPIPGSQGRQEARQPDRRPEEGGPEEGGPEEGGTVRPSLVTGDTEQQFESSRPHRASSARGLGEGPVSGERWSPG